MAVCPVPVSVNIETPLQDDVRRMIRELNAYLIPLSPVQFQFQMTAEEMAEPDTIVFVARNGDQKAVGVGALKTHPGRMGEVKRMYASPEMRGKGVGAALLNEIVGHARKQKLDIVMLETGIGKGFESAWRLYQRAGFVRRQSFADYPDSGYSAFFEKALTQ